MSPLWSHRLAGALVVVLGALNLGVAVLAWTTDLIHLGGAIGGGFVVVGVAMVAVGMLVWRGSRGATLGAFTVFTVLLVFQVSELVASTPDPTATVADQPVARLVVLAVVAVALAVASWRLRAWVPARRRER